MKQINWLNKTVSAAIGGAMLLSLMQAPILAAEAEAPMTLEYGEIKPGRTAYTFMPSTNVQQEVPPETSKLLTSLKPGTAVQIVEKTSKNASVNGFEDAYYKVKVASQAGVSAPVTGFVWGGYLSKSAIPQGKALLVLAISGKGKEDVQKKARAILIEDGKILSEASFEPIELAESHAYGYSISASKFDTAGFTGKPPITKFRFEYGACDYPYGDVLVGTVNNKVSVLLKEIDSGNETGGTGHDFILPAQKGGVKNSLVVLRTEEEFEQKKKHTKRVVYLWNGAKFVAH